MRDVRAAPDPMTASSRRMVRPSEAVEGMIHGFSASCRVLFQKFGNPNVAAGGVVKPRARGENGPGEWRSSKISKSAHQKDVGEPAVKACAWREVEDLRSVASVASAGWAVGSADILPVFSTLGRDSLSRAVVLYVQWTSCSWALLASRKIDISGWSP